MFARLRINDLRILGSVDIAPARGLNLVSGGNGAGKTSVLEGLFLLGRGRSFRQTENGPLIREGADACVVFGEIETHLGTLARVGVSKTRGDTRIKVDGREIGRMSDLARLQPLISVSPNSQFFLDLGPEVRRRFLDLAVFHVEHGFHQVFSEYARLLKQRNSALKTGKKNVVTNWNALFVERAEDIDRARRSVSQILAERTKELISEWGLDVDVEFEYRRGWPSGRSLAEALEEKCQIEMEQGFSASGPHRADWELRSGLHRSRKKLSRGQQKLLVLALHMALADLWREQGLNPVVLIDDIAAELERTNRDLVVSHCARNGGQFFFTALDETAMDTTPFQRMFHVEHGTVRPVDGGA